MAHSENTITSDYEYISFKPWLWYSTWYFDFYQEVRYFKYYIVEYSYSDFSNTNHELSVDL
jgi:hypothetical protein